MTIDSVCVLVSDVKPGNILFPSASIPMLADFGFALRFNHSDVFQGGGGT